METDKFPISDQYGASRTKGSLVGSKLGSAAFIAADKSPSKCLKATKAAELGVFTFWFG
jgi:hypothetical protein